MKPRLLIIDGGLSGSSGNTCEILKRAENILDQHLVVDWCTLADSIDHEHQLALLQSADALLVGTGTYWGSCSSVLQEFFERMTATEGTEAWLGKPVGVVVSAHSAGAEMVLARLQLTLNLFGALIPPMTCMTYMALTHEITGPIDVRTEAWQLEDLEVICYNLIQAVTKEYNWKAWPTDRVGFKDVWMKDNK
jgi:NAD(P)H-dependent FMN reductase